MIRKALTILSLLGLLLSVVAWGVSFRGWMCKLGTQTLVLTNGEAVYLRHGNHPLLAQTASNYLNLYSQKASGNALAPYPRIGYDVLADDPIAAQPHGHLERTALDSDRCVRCAVAHRTPARSPPPQAREARPVLEMRIRPPRIERAVSGMR